MKPLTQWTQHDIIDFFRKADKKVWIKFAAIGAAVFLVLILIIWPAWFKRLGIRDEIKNTKAKIQTLETLRIKKSEWIHNKTDYAHYVAGIKQRLYTSSESSLLLGEISKLAKESNVVIIASRPQDVSAKFPAPYDQNYESRYYNFVVEGGYHELGALMSRIESYPKLLRIQKFKITPRDDKPASHLAEIQLAVIAVKKGSAG
ncbi:MAG: type 4a pilus biogenesis protein PilO [Candidatus Omnitrophica bacterium]|nr:type 4a pilus biogenesis protein PilO [Candidatus Omnitrophota bacterium]